MKKIIAGLFLLGSSSVAFADAAGGPNCGWGNMLFEGQSGPAPHILSAQQQTTLPATTPLA